MMHVVRSAFFNFLSPILARPCQAQVAALCVRDGAQGQEVLLITSRDTGRWVIPKGWPMTDKTDAQAALQEAWEEAGVRKADVSERPIGSYRYDKRLEDGTDVPVLADVYLAKVKTMKDDFPEAAERTRTWFFPADAAELVHEPELSAILRGL